MTRPGTHRLVAVKLLAHGPLQLREFAMVTGWSYKRSSAVLRELLFDGFLMQPKRGVYQLPPEQGQAPR